MKKKSRKKQKKIDSILIPNFIFQDRTLSVLEVIVEYLKEEKNMSFHEIALALKRDDRTIWTVYSRARKKRQKKKRKIKKQNKERKMKKIKIKKEKWRKKEEIM